MNVVNVTPELMVLCNHIYEYKKGVRNLILFTLANNQVQNAVTRLQRQNIDYILQAVGDNNVNIFFGRRECLEAIRTFVNRPLNKLSPEEDFILGALLGYDVCQQCERFCERKKRTTAS
ncbi:MAG: DUF2023 family protein [Bacteroidales bacterium]|jgi:hypothetical protein|nr:DUF2023 family protein [Bacteroidales bacterium]MBP5418526.1 DUF2023 family protein [Bacteroidales bacterium]MCR5697097.1 DUF2023 family protein [Marinilabiliaceae bacterium]